MKDWKCHACGCNTEVSDDYEAEYCCDGGFLSACGCLGKPTNPVFCSECESKMFPESARSVNVVEWEG